MEINAVAFDFDQRWQRPLLAGLLMRLANIAPPADTRPKLSTIRRAGKAAPGDFLHILINWAPSTISADFDSAAETLRELLGTAMCTAVTPLHLSNEGLPVLGGVGGKILLRTQADILAKIDTADQMDWPTLAAYLRARYGDAPLALYQW